MLKKMLFILNPMAGTKKANKQMTEILSEFNRDGYLVSTWVTQEPGDARKAAMEMAKGMDLVVCCGGDGTFHDTVSGLMDMGYDIPIGYIPAGSTNDFGVSLGLQMNPVAAARDIVEGTAQKLDLGRFGTDYFAYVASFGAFTRTSYATSQSMKNALGHVAYLLGGIGELSQIRSVPVRVEIDGVVLEESLVFGAVSNCSSMAGVLSLKPEMVDMQDGLFEVLLVRRPKDLAELGECLLAIQRKDLKCKMITLLTGKHIRVEMDPSIDWSLDGELAKGQGVVEIQNLHHAYTLRRKQND